MKKGKILLSFALLCSPFWLTAAQNSGASQNSSAASSASKISSSQSSRAAAASRSSTLPASNLASNSAAPKTLHKSLEVALPLQILRRRATPS